MFDDHTSSSNRKHPSLKTTCRVERVRVVCCWKRWLIAKQEKWIRLPTYCEQRLRTGEDLFCSGGQCRSRLLTHEATLCLIPLSPSGVQMTWGSWYFMLYWQKTQHAKNNTTSCFPHLRHLAQRATRVMLRTRKTTRETMPTSGEENQPIMPTMPTGAIAALLCEERQNRRQKCQRCGPHATEVGRGKKGCVKSF